MLLRCLAALLVAASLSGCEVYTPASPEDIARARYVSPDAPSVTLMSMVNTKTGKSAHSGLLINGSQQVLYDPAGTFTHPDLPRSGDIHYGMSPRFVDYYERYHARFDYFVEAQKVPVSREEADRIIANAQARGGSFKLECALTTAAVLQSVPPFDHYVHTTLFPESLRQDFAQIPGVKDRFVYESDVGQNKEWVRPVKGEAIYSDTPLEPGQLASLRGGGS
ncbi:MAG: hypothetical protein U1E34_11635 [Amaricoccus sp.]